jgi:two-component system sensor histidine kinase MprB
MSLRAKVALALALLAAAAVVAVSFTSYVVTGNSVHAETDRSLRSYGQQLQDVDGNRARVLCSTFVPPEGQPDHGGPDEHNQPVPELPGAQVQCLNASGAITHSSIDDSLPVTDDDRAVAKHEHSARFTDSATRDGVTYRVYTVPVSPSGAVQIAQGTQSASRALDTVRDRSLLVGAIVILLAAGAGWLIARRAAAPLAALAATAERIAETGKPEAAPIAIGGRDEVGRLGRAFSTMLGALTRARDQQQRLAQDAGHELRTPLTSLRTNIETLRRHRDLPDPVRERVLDDLTGEAGELQALVEELVALVVDDDDDDDTAVTFDLAGVVERQAERAHRRSDRIITVDADASRVHGHPRRVERLVANLLENAAKFSSDGQPIEVSVHAGTLTVRDHGAGFEPRDLEHVFDRFYRAEAARSRPGSGLGLSIVQEIAHAHDATVQASNAKDGGALLTVTFPTI